MKCTILHESKNRLRVHLAKDKLTLHQADILEHHLTNISGVKSVTVYDRTADVVIFYTNDRHSIIHTLASFSFSEYHGVAIPSTCRELNRQFQDKLSFIILKRIFKKIFLPTSIRAVLTVLNSLKYIYHGLCSLLKGKIEVALLDATAITASILRGDYSTASSVMFLLKIGDTLEEWTHKKSVDDLARVMSLNVENVWVKNNDLEVLTPISEVSIGDTIIVRTGNIIPLDGKIISGEVMVNQSSITGESLPIAKKVGSFVYASTVVEEGECFIRVESISSNSKYSQIVKMIEDSEKLKSSSESQAASLADKLVPFSLLGTIATYLFTRDIARAVSILMVDFSCALKLAMPLSVLSAIREANLYHISIKGGKYIEAVAQADTIVFDKTGTLTYSLPKVVKVETFNGQEEDEMLRLAACLEEHYPHSMAKAVVTAAQDRNLHHEERHSKVEYIVAHGISSIVDEQKVVIGSYHFVFEDEKCIVPQNELEKFHSISSSFSHLYLAISGVLSAVICISDPIREEAPTVINTLRKLGVKNIVMMTGDNKKTAAAVAASIGFDEYYAEVLPEDKASFIRAERAAGRKVIMVGDGINDSPALSESDVGIAISEGADIAREIADITISADDLYALITLKELSDALMLRIRHNYEVIIGFNFLLIILGVAGVIPSATSALLHNTSTIAISLKSMTNLLPPPEDNNSV